jgi:hypothetical protein
MGVGGEFAKVVEGIVGNRFANGCVWRVDGGIRLPSM